MITTFGDGPTAQELSDLGDDLGALCAWLTKMGMVALDDPVTGNEADPRGALMVAADAIHNIIVPAVNRRAGH